MREDEAGVRGQVLSQLERYNKANVRNFDVEKNCYTGGGAGVRWLARYIRFDTGLEPGMLSTL